MSVDTVQQKPKKKNNKGMVFGIAAIVVAAVCVPYVYLSYTVNKFGVSNGPEGYQFPTYDMMYKTCIGAVVCQVSKMIIKKLSFGTFYSIAKKK